MRYRFKLTCFMSSEKNRLQNCLTVSNIQLASVVSDTFGKSSLNILNRILEDPSGTSFDIEPLIHGSMRDKIPQLELAIDGYIAPEQAGKLKVIKKHFVDLESIGVNMEAFPSAKHLCSWAGLTPTYLALTLFQYLIFEDLESGIIK